MLPRSPPRPRTARPTHQRSRLGLHCDPRHVPPYLLVSPHSRIDLQTPHTDLAFQERLPLWSLRSFPFSGDHLAPPLPTAASELAGILYPGGDRSHCIGPPLPFLLAKAHPSYNTALPLVLPVILSGGSFLREESCSQTLPLLPCSSVPLSDIGLLRPLWSPLPLASAVNISVFL